MHPLRGWQSVAIRACSLLHLQPHQRRNWLSRMEPTLGTRWRPHSDNLLTPALKNPPMRAQPTSWSIASCQKRVLLTGAPASSSVVHTEWKYRRMAVNWWGLNVGSPWLPKNWKTCTAQHSYVFLHFTLYIFIYIYKSDVLFVLSCYTFAPFMWGCRWWWWTKVKILPLLIEN